MARGVVIVAAAALLAVAAADCPNACSGNGRCSAPLDYCECYSGFMGNDCSQRVCPFGLAHVDSPQGDLAHNNDLNDGYGDRTAATGSRPTGTPTTSAVTPMWRPKGWWERHPSQLYGTDDDKKTDGSFLELYARKEEGHFYAECSSRGICDRETGICGCFTGYEGVACNRTACPNDCSGHGTCRNLRQASPSNTDYRLWDSDKNFGCECDAEYTANDCSQRRCYKNDDPLTDKTATRGVSENLWEAGEVQRIKVACAHGGEFTTASSITLKYTDVQFGETYETSSLTVGATADQSSAILAALRALPNDVLASTNGYDKVTAVTRLDTMNSIQVQDHHNHKNYYYFVTFSDSLGNVPLMTADTTGMQCKAGWELPTGYLQNGWLEVPVISYGGDALTMGPTVSLTLDIKRTNVADSTAFYKVTINDAAAASAVFTAASIDLNNLDGTATDYLDDKIMELLPMLFDFRDDTSVVTRGTQNTGQITINFYAGAPAVEIVTPYFETSASLPIQYAVLGDGTANSWMFLELADPLNPIVYVDANANNAVDMANAEITITVSGASGTLTVASGGAALGATPNVWDGWGTLKEDPIGTRTYFGSLKLAWSIAAASHQASDKWVFQGNLGWVGQHKSDSSDETGEDIQLANTGNERAQEEVDIVIEILSTAVAATGSGRLAGPGVATDHYKYTLNGVEMGTFFINNAASALGDSDMGRPSDINTFSALWYDAAYDGSGGEARNAGEKYFFSLIRTPYQSEWGYQETFAAWYFRSNVPTGALTSKQVEDGRTYTANANSNFGLVINWIDISGNPDKYRWKLSNDEVWMDNSGNGYSLTSGALLGAGQYSHSFRPSGMVSAKHSELDNFAFYLSGGVDNANRACDAGVNSYLYIQLGKEGRNDFSECSDRGLCNVETGECECFKGYKGTDCSIQSALAF